MNYIKVVTQTCQNETKWNIKGETKSKFIHHVLNHKRGSDTKCRHFLKFGIYFILTLGLFNNNLSWKSKKSGYSSESKDIKDLQISGNLLFASFDFEFCFLLLGDPNVDFDLFILKGGGFPTLPYHISWLS